MSSYVISNIQHITPAWLNPILAKNGLPHIKSANDIEIQQSKSTKAHLAKIQVSYATEGTGTTALKLLLKMCPTETDGFSSSEVDYYTRDYVDLLDAPLVHCYDACYSAEAQSYHILMDDLTATHRNNWQTQPTYDYGRATVQAMAKLHAHWWGEQRLRKLATGIPGTCEITRYLAHIQPGLLPMLQDAADEMEPAWAALLPTIFARHADSMHARTRQEHGFTLTHGDLNPGNILSPRSGHDPVYLIDRQPFEWSLTAWLGVSDVAYMLVHWWDTELRRKYEFVLLKDYHVSLLRYGVTDYSWEQLVADYKLCAVQSIYVATEWCVTETDRINMRWVWLPQLKRSMAAFFDLHCDELWT